MGAFHAPLRSSFRKAIAATAVAASLLAALAFASVSQAFYVDPTTAEWYSVAEDKGVNKVLTRNEPFGALEGSSHGTTVTIFNSQSVQVDERRDYAPDGGGQGTPPCFRYRTNVSNTGRYVGVQSAWRVSCSSGVILANGRVDLNGGAAGDDRTWEH